MFRKYAYEICADALKMEKCRKGMASVQRTGTHRVATSYRTVSEPVVLVITGVVPIDLLAQERKHLFEGRDTAKYEPRELSSTQWIVPSTVRLTTM